MEKNALRQPSERKLLCIGPRPSFHSINHLLREPIYVVHQPTIADAVAALREYDPFDLIAVAPVIMAEGGPDCLDALKRQAPGAHLIVLPAGVDDVEDTQPGHEPAPAHPVPTSCDKGWFQVSDFGHRVLVVEDDPFVLKLVAKTLRDVGYEVLTACNGTEAMRLLLDQGAQIVVSDWLMPEMDGIQLCRAVRSNESVGFVYFMVVTAVTERHRILEALEAGVDDYVTKPFEIQSLLVRMHVASRVVALESDIMRRNREVHKSNAEMAILNNKLQNLATTDELTGLTNRRRALEKLRDLWTLAHRYNIPISCVMVDIDRFKAVNDTYGHAAGDAVLKSVARQMAAAARTTDMVSRVGGEEFLVLTPNTDGPSAAILAERIRVALVDSPVVFEGVELSVSASFGVAEKTADIPDADALMREADAALYAAKASGRNRVCIAGEHAPAPAAVG